MSVAIIAVAMTLLHSLCGNYTKFKKKIFFKNCITLDKTVLFLCTAYLIFEKH